MNGGDYCRWHQVMTGGGLQVKANETFI